MSGRSKLNLANVLFAFVLHVVLNLLWVPQYGILGAAWATTLSIVLSSLITCLELTVLLRIFPYRLDFLKPLGAGLASAAVVFLLGKYALPERGLFPLITLAVVFALAYLGLLLLLGLAKEDKIVLDKLKDKVLRWQP